MKNLFVFAVLIAAMALACPKSSTIFETTEDVTEEIEVDPNLPHDFPHILIPPNATYSHGSTGAMKAVPNPNGFAVFKTDESPSDMAEYYVNLVAGDSGKAEDVLRKEGNSYIVEGFVPIYLGTDNDSIHIGNSQAKVEIYRVKNNGRGKYTQIYVTYWAGLSIPPN